LKLKGKKFFFRHIRKNDFFHVIIIYRCHFGTSKKLSGRASTMQGPIVEVFWRGDETETFEGKYAYSGATFRSATEEDIKSQVQPIISMKVELPGGGYVMEWGVQVAGVEVEG